MDIIRLKQSDMSVATPGLPRTAASVVDLIGNTPLIRLSNFEGGLRNVELYAKAEWKNPGGSVKDRPAARMIADGERSGALTRNKILLDATSGNTGIAYAMLGAAKGFRVRLCVPGNVTPERKRILKAFGAESDGLIESDSLADDRGFADHDAGAVIDEKIASDGRCRMNIDSRRRMRDIRDKTGRQARA